ncbi:hypothetical protein TSAR_009810 [Trichomalopsis sarcophagae]|uniref:Uncharacterized protein n=1 Tax=Trichomalopsis sarcophagae TaxID=543379 RepID=A0A232ETD9_9HYME|nr:hypothetical protein TSAR_009810 [Trichomalopsis sarcophagae]
MHRYHDVVTNNTRKSQKRLFSPLRIATCYAFRDIDDAPMRIFLNHMCGGRVASLSQPIEKESTSQAQELFYNRANYATAAYPTQRNVSVYESAIAIRYSKIKKIDL